MNRRISAFGALVAAGLLAAGCSAESGSGSSNGSDAGSGTFPSGTVHIVVGSGPGSTMDMLARGLAPRLQALWGESVVVDNVPGANQSAAYHEAAGADPDGHTLFLGVHGTMGIHDQLGTIDPGWQEFEWFGTILEEPWTLYTAADGDIKDLDACWPRT